MSDVELLFENDKFEGKGFESKGSSIKDVERNAETTLVPFEVRGDVIGNTLVISKWGSHFAQNVVAQVLEYEASTYPYFYGCFNAKKEVGAWCLFPIEAELGAENETLEDKLRKIPIRSSTTNGIILLSILQLANIIAIIISLVKIGNGIYSLVEVPWDWMISFIIVGVLIYMESKKTRYLLDKPYYLAFILSTIALISHLSLSIAHSTIMIFLDKDENEDDQSADNTNLCIGISILSIIQIIFWVLFMFYERETPLLKLNIIGDWIRENLYFEQTFQHNKIF